MALESTETPPKVVLLRSGVVEKGEGDVGGRVAEVKMPAGLGCRI